MLNKYDKKEYKIKMDKIKRYLPKECKECFFLQIINLEKQIVYCPYRIKNKCLINKEKNL